MHLYDFHLYTQPERSLNIRNFCDFTFQKTMNYSEHFVVDFSNEYLKCLLGYFQTKSYYGLKCTNFELAFCYFQMLKCARNIGASR